jgi:hypothetical protein
MVIEFSSCFWSIIWKVTISVLSFPLCPTVGLNFCAQCYSNIKLKYIKTLLKLFGIMYLIIKIQSYLS